MVKRVLILAGVVIGVVIVYGVKNAFGISDDAFTKTVLFLLIVWSALHFSHRLEAIEERVVHSNYDRIKNLIEEGKRHKPHHQQPKSLIEGGAVETFITAAHEVLFDDFRWFGAALNQHVAEPWAVEELNDTDVQGIDGPEVGRRYQVYYNACRMGTVQVTIGGHTWIFRPETFADNREARVEVDLNYLRFVPYNDAHSLISTVALFVGKFGDDGDAARAEASAVATAALTRHLWESVRNPDIDMCFEFRTDGPYELLRGTSDHWKAEGIDPFETWGGDRSWADQNADA
ncbi:hypothetical protein [Mesorhizobium escarrei]|uniref:Uncharacterized protein n=1 Tax=Mesorhizobium escarrei TaxID=666018 RepID=A0ABN8KFI3_9HYPH|nr:hypothetical protein [Mesorhizobium escarrei]CAH2407930.1 conserved hypothetical protein [Mesorhizobium escarrei]